jgi:hypothetical protein
MRGFVDIGGGKKGHLGKTGGYLVKRCFLLLETCIGRRVSQKDFGRYFPIPSEIRGIL